MFVGPDVGLVTAGNMSHVTTAELASTFATPDTRSLKESYDLEDKKPQEARKDGRELNRSASEINLHAMGGGVEEGGAVTGGMKRVFSDTSLATTSPNTTESRGGSTIDGVKKTLRRHSIRLRKEPKVTVSQYSIPQVPTESEIAQLPKAIVKNSRLVVDPKGLTPELLPPRPKRGNWILGSSRSPSPSNRKSQAQATRLPDKVMVRKSSTGDSENTDLVTSDNPSPLQLQRKNTSGAKGRRPMSAVFGRSKSMGEIASAAPIPKSFSTGRLPSPGADLLPDLPKPISRDKYQNSGLDTPRKKDELWSNFRTLDGEFQKFSSKPGPVKTTVIRTALLPFLRQYADHPSNTSLRAEDLDRRVNILNKWWMGLLEMLNGRNGQSVSGSDRPAVLEGLSTIMARSEWLLSVSDVSSRGDRSRPILKSRSSSSLETNMSDFLAESVIHNVRNTFIQNLLSQMAFVVDKMSMRSAPASVVTFCGKACAYAFFFCPGVADILVRLWSLSSETIRRVLAEYNMPRNVNLADTAELVALQFPPHLRPLAFSSLPKTMRSLRGKPSLPLNSAYIPWNGPWAGRWSGRDSDLFFCFTKHYHVLACALLPDSPTVEQRLSAPCNLVVQAQILVVMDATIHRTAQAAHSDSSDNPVPLTFDDVLGADSSALPIAGRAPNTTRLMGENRLIMLLREFLSDSPSVKETARKSFADLFRNLMKAAARRTSLYDHNACFTLCDFLEEAIAILSRYYRDPNDPCSFLDWNFWLDVFKQMGESNNTMTEIRLYAFIYRFWGFISKNESRKGDICFGWLLREDYATRQFNHWCPMVRAYYMRVLCWKVTRFDGEATATDLEIYRIAQLRLRTTWSHFLYVQNEATSDDRLPPSTAPSNPAPGRRMLIIRDDSVPTTNGSMRVFDDMVAESLSFQPTAYETYASLDPLTHLSAEELSKPRASSPGRKRWTTLRNMNPFSSSSSGLSKGISSENEKSTAGAKATNAVQASSSTDSTPTPSRRTSPNRPPHASHSFKFSLEWADRSLLPRERKLNLPRLPGPAQMFLQSQDPGRSLPGFTADKSLPGPVQPRTSVEVEASKYGGRALAEWALLVSECGNFYERRKAEGVPENRWVETPTLGVESFRRPSG